MNRLIFLFTFGFISSSFSQIVNIPDENFKTYLISNMEINTFPDDEIEVSEALAYTDSIICVGLQIEDLTGIEAFENITFLSCVNNALTSLDVSHNLALESLICALNGITTLDVSNNLALRNLRCSYNPLQTIHVGSNVNLEYLYCENNQLSSLDLSNNPGLLELSCYTNALHQLDLSHNPQLRYLNCIDNQMVQLNLAASNDLEEIRCYGNNLTAIDLSQSASLKIFMGFINNFTSLDVTNCPLLERFDCAFNSVATLDLSFNHALTYVSCFSNPLTYLNLANGNNMNLTQLLATGSESTCIRVDDQAYCNANWVGNSMFQIDPEDVYSESCSLGVKEAILNFEISPNPAADVIQLDVTKDAAFRIVSISGDLLMTGKLTAGPNVLSLSELAAGMYIVHIYSNTQSIQKPVQKI